MQARPLFFVTLFACVGLLGCTQTAAVESVKPIEPSEQTHQDAPSPSQWVRPDYPHAIYRIDVARLLAGDMRYNLVIQDGDVLWPSHERLVSDEDCVPMPPVDRVRPDGNREARPYFIKPNDLLRVTIYELRRPGIDDIQDRRVAENGELRLAVVGLIKAENRTPELLEVEIAGRLKELGLLEEATVTVQCLSGVGRYRVVGQILSFEDAIEPGVYMIPTPDYRVLTAAQRGGFPTLSEFEHFYLIRRLPQQRATD